MENVKYKILDIEYDKMFKKLPLAIVIFLGLVYLGTTNYLAYHVIAELYSAIMAFMMVSISINTYKINKDNKIIFLGIAYGFIAFFDLIHMMTYKGMSIFGDDTANIPTQLWIVARYLESLSFSACFLLPKKKYKLRMIFSIYLCISILILVSIFNLNIFPDCYIDNSGLTSFKVISEYIICGILFFNILYFIKQKHGNLNKNDSFIVFSLIATSISEMFLVFYIDVYSLANMMGHIFKLASYYFVYIALIQSSLQEPYFGLIELNNILDNKNKRLEKLIYHLKSEVDKRKSLEVENLKKREILDSVLESSMDGILVVDNCGRIIHYNNLLIKMWNISYEMLFDGDYTKPLELARNQLNNIEEFDDFINKSWDYQVSRSCELYIKDGRTIEAFTVPLINKGVKMGKVISFRDITRRNEILELQKEIQIKQILLEKAKEFDEVKNSFFATVSHEFRTPLNIILGVIQLLPYVDNEDKGYSDNVLVGKYVDMVKQNCYRLIKLANNFIDITKIDAGYMEMNFKNYNIVSLIEDITLSIVGYSNSMGISLIFDTEVEELITACDADKLERIMLNLLSNAIKFVGPGGNVKVNLKKKEENVIISVKDNGEGIPGEMIETIFDRFKQVDSTLRRKKEGSGIGLSIVKSMVEMHGGTISLDSEIGKGSEFIIILPITLVEENNINPMEYTAKEINVDKINIEFSDIYELNHI